MATPDYQVGAHFKALNESDRMAAGKFIGFFFAFQVSLPDRAIHPNYMAGVHQRSAIRKALTVPNPEPDMGRTAVPGRYRYYRTSVVLDTVI